MFDLDKAALDRWLTTEPDWREGGTDDDELVALEDELYDDDLRFEEKG